MATRASLRTNPTGLGAHPELIYLDDQRRLPNVPDVIRDTQPPQIAVQCGRVRGSSRNRGRSCAIFSRFVMVLMDVGHSAVSAAQLTGLAKSTWRMKSCATMGTYGMSLTRQERCGARV